MNFGADLLGAVADKPHGFLRQPTRWIAVRRLVMLPPMEPSWTTIWGRDAGVARP